MSSDLQQELDSAIKLFSDVQTRPRQKRRRAGLFDDSDEDSQELQSAAITSLKRVGEVIRQAQTAGLDDKELMAMTERAAKAERSVLFWAYMNPSSGYDFFPIYSGELVKDGSSGALAGFMAKFQAMFGITLPSGAEDTMDMMPGNFNLYNPQAVPSFNSTPLAAFKKKPDSLQTDAQTNALREARCEIQTYRICSPIRLVVGGGAVVVQGCGGYKQRDPTLDILKLGLSTTDFDDFRQTAVEQGHLDICYQQPVIDGSKRLLWTADEKRIKSTEFEFGEDNDRSFEPMHTFDSSGFTGPIALINDGAQLLRSGRNELAIWDTTSAPTHASSAKNIIGKRLPRSTWENTWRSLDDDGYIEKSSGSPFTTRLSFHENVDKAIISNWTPNPSMRNKGMICASDDTKYAVFGLDIETGKKISQYLGHGALVPEISTTAHDNNVFLTSCQDGAARLYDVRVPMPTITMFTAAEKIMTSALVSSGGGLYAFVGGYKSEHVKLWDIRSRSALYELSTGNNMVISLGWDEEDTTLYAATECLWMDRMGYRHDYRPAKDPKDEAAKKERRQKMATPDDDDEDYDSEDDSEDDEDYEHGWPSDASHFEGAFNYLFDSGDHRLFRYAFKSNADVTVLPEYGDAMPGEIETSMFY